jgi:hypothetical protein
MGNETNISLESSEKEEEEEQTAVKASSQVSQKNKVYGSSTKRGINQIQDTSISMKMRGPTQ